jgi:hypothetical protein
VTTSPGGGPKTEAAWARKASIGPANNLARSGRVSAGGKVEPRVLFQQGFRDGLKTCVLQK